MNIAPLFMAAGATMALWPRPRVWRRLPTRRAARRSWGVDPIWPTAAAPIVVALLVGLPAALAVAIVATTTVVLRRRSARRATHEAQRDELRRGVAVMIAEMSVGAPVVLACRSAADELARDGPSEVSAGLARMAARAELGGDPGEVAEHGDHTVDRDETVAPLDRLASAWAASDRWGLPMIDLLQMLRSDLTARAEHASRTRAGLAGPRATAMILAFLPLLGIGLGHLMGAAPLAVLLSSGIGGVVLVIGTALAAAGVFWTAAITEKALR